jgi:hypothetical protein
MNSSLRSSDSIFAAHSAHLVLPQNLFKAIRKTSKTIKKILPINSIPKAFQHSSTKATSRQSEIGRTSISGSFSLLLSFGEAKERRERPDHSARFALPQKLFKAIMKTPYIKQIINSEAEQCYCSLSLQ